MLTFFLSPSFIAKQLSAAMFALFLLALILSTHFLYPEHVLLARYDFMLLCAVNFQVFLLVRGYETKKEFAVVLLFHGLAMCMEIFKVHMNSWIYPGRFYVGIFGVPLFAGFMYSAVGSYLVRLHGQFDIRYNHMPSVCWLLLLTTACYVNFFTHHFIWDVRWLLTVMSVVVLWRCQMVLSLFKTPKPHLSDVCKTQAQPAQKKQGKRQITIPVLVPLGLVAVLIWVAENIATYSRVWHYPNQVQLWQMVSVSKISSWYLLLLLSFALVLVFLFGQGKKPIV